MERLTIKAPSGLIHFRDNKEHTINLATKKLSDYEDAEEQGLILKLSYKVGDVVYYSKEYLTDREVQPYEITNLMISCNKKGEWTKKYSAMRLVDGKTIDDRLDFAFEEIGTTVFLTKEEAEQTLKQIGE